MRKITYLEIKQKIESTNGCILITPEDKYTNTKCKLEVACKCGKHYETTYDMFRNKNRTRCVECAKSSSIENRKVSYVDACLFLQSIECEMVTSEYDYIDTKNNIDVMCSCNNIFTTTIHDLKGNKRPKCKKCTIKNTIRSQLKPYAEVKEHIESYGNKLITTERDYKNTKTKLNIECSCGEIFVTDYNTFTVYNKFRCRTCSRKLSLGEYNILQYLKRHNIKYIQEYKFNDCVNILPLPFDFAIFNNNELVYLIEFDGLQHYKPCTVFGGQERFDRLKINDDIKTSYCLSNNIPLLRISYKDINNIDNILKRTFGNTGFGGGGGVIL